MKRTINFISMLTVLLLVGSCEKNVTIDLRNVDKAPKITVSCFISPQDTVITASVSKSSPLYSAYVGPMQIETIKTAAVLISDGNTTQQLIYNISKQRYTLSAKAFPIIAGVNYKLQVDVTNFKTVTANTSVPLTNNTTLQVDSQTVADPSQTTVSIIAKWQDKVNEVNYYGLVFVGKLNTNPLNKDTVAQEFGRYSITDINRDGSSFRIKQETSMKTAKTKYGYDKCDVYLLNVSKEYYELHKSLEVYTPNDPFTEASPIYSNMENGLGVFAGYNGYKVQLK